MRRLTALTFPATPRSIERTASCSCCSSTRRTPGAASVAGCSAPGHDALREAGCKAAFLFTHEQNQRALAVYEAAGYRPDGTVRESDFNGTSVRELRLVKQL